MARNNGMAFDLSILGDRALQRRIKKLERKVQRKMLSSVLRDSAKRIKPKIVERFKQVTTEQTGQTSTALQGMKVRSAGGGRNAARIGIEWPTRDELGIPPDARSFYPAAIEYGHGSVAARPFVRPAVDNDSRGELDRIRDDLRARILRGF